MLASQNPAQELTSLIALLVVLFSIEVVKVQRFVDLSIDEFVHVLFLTPFLALLVPKDLIPTKPMHSFQCLAVVLNNVNLLVLQLHYNLMLVQLAMMIVVELRS